MLIRRAKTELLLSTKIQSLCPHPSWTELPAREITLLKNSTKLFFTLQGARTSCPPIAIIQTNILARVVVKSSGQDVRAPIIMKSKTNEQFHYPLIETERLVLRMFEAADLDAAFVIFNDDDVQKYLSPANRRTRQQLKVTLEKLALRWQERGFGIWCVCEKSNNKMIGYSGFQYLDDTPQVELLFGFLKDFWGGGFATEAANGCLRFGFEEAQFAKICAATHPENLASRRVLEKIGMAFDKKSEHYQTNSITFTVSRDEYAPSKNFYKLSHENHFQIETKPPSLYTSRNSLVFLSSI